MAKKQPERNLYLDLCQQTLMAMTKLLAHHSDDKDFGGEDVGRLKSEYEPLIMLLKDNIKRERCINELKSFEAWCLNYRKKIIDKYYKGETNDE